MLFPAGLVGNLDLLPFHASELSGWTSVNDLPRPPLVIVEHLQTFQRFPTHLA
jgi:hypothetical protein